MYITLVILAIIVCVLLALIILIQNPKGGGLSSGFSGSNNVMGVQRTGDFLEKGTWVLVISLMVIVLVLNMVPPGGSANSTESIQNEVSKPAGSSPMTQPLPGIGDTTKK
ncbi:preprotein translocase subunit SecG [Paradesertivirga mongoliensis]|uniref:Protein-export membrane protein SecG n=1 Tax=Paradesertivirga mongoliensis TaxID=2100740 RepID=A0ABW4ZHC4_9SPHI|nr:preprotein translocase subunit SecG [Pedobacter mongoliensis]